MWFLGLVLGALIGAIAGGPGAAIGALAGAIGGLWLSQRGRVVHDERLDAIEAALRTMQVRIEALEARHTGEIAAPPREADVVMPAASAAAIEPAAAAIPSESTEAVPPRPLDIPPDAVPAEVPARVEPSRVSAPPEVAAPNASRAPAKPLDPTWLQVAAIAIGTLIGLGFGLGGMFVGALVGGVTAWVVGIAVVSQNQRAARDRAAALEMRAQSRATPVPPATTAPLASDAAAAQPAADSGEPSVAIAPPLAESSPTLLQRLVGGNIVAKIGVLILFLGVGFLLKYAYDQGRLPVQVRLAVVALLGFAMLWGGRRLLATRRLYGLILQGGGIGLLYLDVFFALRLYGLVGATAGFAAFMALGVAATLLAVRQDAKVLAVLGLTGAFLAPILASTGSGNHVVLFSYYTLLNGFILAISWFKAWRDLNLVGFIFTFAVSLIWGANHYRPELFGTVEPFVLVFFAMYLVIPILFAQRQPPELRGWVDGTLVFGTPICAAFMQSGLVKDMPYGLAWSAGIAGALYGLLAFITLRRAGMRLLGETYVALAVVFITLAIFFAFDAYPTFALWTLEGAAIVWVGLRQRRVPGRFFGLALQLAGSAYFLTQYAKYDLANPWWNAFVVGCAIIALAGFIIAWLLHRYRDVRSASEPADWLMLVWGASWWSIGGLHALHDAYPWHGFIIACLVFTAASVAAAELIGSYLKWASLRRVATALAPVMVLTLVLQAADGSHPFEYYGGFAWPAALGVLYFVLRRQERDLIALLPPVQHLTAFWVALVVLTWEAAWQVHTAGFGKPWVTAVGGLVPALAIGWISSKGKTAWPFSVDYASVYRDVALRAVAAYLMLWLLYANLSAPGEMRPLLYVPLLNPLDIAHLVIFAAAWQWSRTLEPAQESPDSLIRALFAALGFLWLNCVMLRSIHYWTGIDYEWHAMMDSVSVQSGFSLLWTATAFVLMLYATRIKRRQLWMLGAGLLGAVVLKLFLNDLSSTGTVARIVSFIGVGAGLLLIGYVAPVPPGDVERQAD